MNSQNEGQEESQAIRLITASIARLQKLRSGNDADSDIHNAIEKLRLARFLLRYENNESSKARYGLKQLADTHYIYYHARANGNVVLNEEFQHLPSLSHYRPKAGLDSSMLGIRDLDHTKTYIVAGDGRHENMWHTCIKTLEDLVDLGHWLDRRILEPRLISYISAHQWTKDIFAILGIKAVYLRPSIYYRIRNTFFVGDAIHSRKRQPLDSEGVFGLSSFGVVRQLASQACSRNPLNKEGCEKIYISRTESTARKLINEEELEEALAKNGYQILKLERLPTVQQLSAFNSAKKIVAPHGAGLCNMIACRDDCEIIELFNPKMNRPCYEYFSKDLNLHKYRRIATESRLGTSHFADIRLLLEMLE